MTTSARLTAAMALAGVAAGVALAWPGPSVAAAESPGPGSGATPASATSAPPTPDGLIAAITTDGTRAFVREDELNQASGGTVANPDEAREWMDHLAELEAQGITEILIPAYLEDGVTVVGEFAISVGQGDPQESISAEELCEVFADDPQFLEEILSGRTCPEAN